MFFSYEKWIIREKTSMAASALYTWAKAKGNRNLFDSDMEK